MKKILIFKSDRIGDLINISSLIKNLKHNFDNSETADPFFDYDGSCPNCEEEVVLGDGFDRKCKGCGYIYDVPGSVI